jgi:hypothetical protein
VHKNGTMVKITSKFNGIYYNDKTNRLIGWVTIRQLRIKSTLCSSIRNFNRTCHLDYHIFNEEKGSFQPGWMNETSTKSSSPISQSFQYKSSHQLDTYTLIGDHAHYDGDGYVYEFRGRLANLRKNLSELHQLGWIDQRTRAVIIQLNFYNPNVRLFTSVSLLTEFLSTGGLYPHSRFEPMNFHSK